MGVGVEKLCLPESESNRKKYLRVVSILLRFSNPASKAFGDIKMAGVDARLAEEVQKYNHLYDSSLKEYKDSVRTSNSRKEIADSIGEEVEFCKKRWRYIVLLRISNLLTALSKFNLQR